MLGVILLGGAVYAVQREFRHLQLADIGRAIQGIPVVQLALAFGCTVLAFAVLTLYDRLGTIYAGYRVAYPRVALASFCATALSHNLGFAAVSGAAVRYRLYSHWGMTPLQIGQTIAFCSLTFGLGAMVLGGAILFTMPDALPYLGDRAPRFVPLALGSLLWAIVVAYVTVAATRRAIRVRGHAVALPTPMMSLLQVGLAVVDVGITASILWMLLPSDPSLSWLLFVGVYLIAYTAGLAANLPGGLGVFDTAILFGLAPYLPAPRIIAAIAVFRLYYYIIPLFLAGGMFAANEVLVRRAGVPAAQLPRWSEPDFTAAAASSAVALSGVLLLGLGLLAAPPEVASPARQIGGFVPSLIGAGLVVMALGLVRRVRLAWFASLILLLAASGFILGGGERVWPVGVLLLAALVLAPFRALFYRHSRLLTGPLDRTSGLSLLALAACGVALAGFRVRVHTMPRNAFWEVVLSPAASWTLRGSLALVVALALAAIWLLLRPGHVRARPFDVEARLRLLMLGATPPERADGIVLGEAERAAVPFRRVGRLLVGLGDPVGAEADKVSAIWRFRDLAAQEDRDPAFWRSGRRFLKVYNDLGLTALPLGPHGTVVPEGSVQARNSREFLVCMAERDYPALSELLERRGVGTGPSS